MRKALATLALVLSALSAPAQFGPPTAPPGGRIDTIPSITGASPYHVPSGEVRPVYSSFGGYPSYGGVYVENPVSGYFNGVANVVSAYGQYGKDYQQSRLLNQDVERSKLSTRRAFIEQQMWEQSLQPTAEDIRRKNIEMDLRRSMHDAPISEIVSGQALNSLLANIQGLQAKGASGPPVPVDQEGLRRVNLSAAPGQNVALFKDGGKLKFPFVLRDTPFDEDREKIQDFVYKAVKETQGDDLSPATLRGLKSATGTLDRKLTSMAPEMSISDMMNAQRFVTDLKTATAALENPSASNYLNKKWSAQGRSAGELVQYMTKNGLRFAPALQGDDSYYRSLYQSLVAYNYGTMQASRR